LRERRDFISLARPRIPLESRSLALIAPMYMLHYVALQKGSLAMDQRMADLGEGGVAAEEIRLRRDRKTREPTVHAVVRRLGQTGTVAPPSSVASFACHAASSRRKVARLNPASF
jgi:hypothetical protein